MTERIATLRASRATAYDEYKVLADKETLTADERIDYTNKEAAVRAFDDQIKRAKAASDLAAATAQPVAGQETVPATVETDVYTKNRGLVLGGSVRMLVRADGSIYDARQASKELYGAEHPVTRALNVSTGTAGGFIVPPDIQLEIIELLRAQAVVRAAGPRSMAMPRGTMTLPAQTSSASASYTSEQGIIKPSQPGLGQIVASYKKLTALVPVTNDMMRYADPAADAFVRDDLIKVLGLTQDSAFLLSDGTLGRPMGWLHFANRWVASNGGTVGTWLTTAASTEAVNGVDPPNSTGGNFVTSTYVFTLTTVAAELAAAQNKLDSANVPDSRRVWFMSPRSRNYLMNVMNTINQYVYRDEMSKGTLFGYPFKATTQILNNFTDAASHSNCSFVFLVEMDESLLLDSMALELAVSREASYLDNLGNTISAFQQDQTLIRAITEHDFQMRHDQSIAVIQGVAWAPTAA